MLYAQNIGLKYVKWRKTKFYRILNKILPLNSFIETPEPFSCVLCGSDLILNINFSSSYSNISCNNYALLNNFPVYARLVKCYELHAWVILPSHSETFWRQTTCVKVYNTSKNHLNTVILFYFNRIWCWMQNPFPHFYLFFLAWYEVIISLFKDLKIYPKFFVSYKKDLEASFHLFFMSFRTLIFIILITAKQQKFIFHVLAFFLWKIRGVRW